MQRRIALAAPALALLIAACEPEQPSEQPFAARLRAQSTSGEPLAGVRFWANGRDLGATQAQGELAVQIRGLEGTTVELRAACPPEYRAIAAVRQVVLRRVRRADGERLADLELVQACEPLQRTAAVVVLATGKNVAGLPVLVDGEPLGQTDADGTAHLLVTAPARTPLRVQLDTGQRPWLRPQDPVHGFRLEDEDTVLLVEQAFRTARPRRKAVVAKRAPPAPPRPQRLE